MRFDPDQLSALLAIDELGSFEAAARELHVTPSAVSQRIRALETRTGQVLVRRGAPCRATTPGRVLVRLGRQTRLLDAEATADLAGTGPRLDLTVAVNADSLATWFRGVLDEVAGWDGVGLRLVVEDQAFTGDLLRSGEVLAAVTSDPVAVQGCSVELLGRLRYAPAATPAIADRHRHGSRPDWARLPMVVFNDKDGLQHDLLAARGLTAPPVVHRVPTSADFLEAVSRGLGWGMLPEPQLLPGLADGTLVRLLAREHRDVPLYWQRWRLESPALTHLTDVVRRSASAQLRH